jgi:hypothetical protein
MIRLKQFKLLLRKFVLDEISNAREEAIYRCSKLMDLVVLEHLPRLSILEAWTCD